MAKQSTKHEYEPALGLNNFGAPMPGSGRDESDCNYDPDFTNRCIADRIADRSN
jgi:hypothetical protein